MQENLSFSYSQNILKQVIFLPDTFFYTKEKPITLQYNSLLTSKRFDLCNQALIYIQSVMRSKLKKIQIWIYYFINYGHNQLRMVVSYGSVYFFVSTSCLGKKRFLNIAQIVVFMVLHVRNILYRSKIWGMKWYQQQLFVCVLCGSRWWSVIEAPPAS